MDNQKFRIKFELTDEFGNDYVNESRVDVCRACGERELDVIGEQLNVFLKQCVSHSRKNRHKKALKNGMNRRNSFDFSQSVAFIPRFA